MEKLYQDLLQVYKDKSSLEYEKKAEQVRKEIKEKDFHFEYDSFVPYPSYKNKQFNQIIYKKEEFHRNRSIFDSSQKYDEVVAERCQGDFKLTPNQKFIKNFMSPLTPYRSLLVYHGVGVGKCFAKDTPILMYDGSIKPVQDVQVGDQVMGDDSKPRNVLSLGRGKDQMYEIAQSHADTYITNSEHILVLKTVTGNVYEMEVKDYVNLPEETRKTLQGYSSLVEFPEITLEYNAYEKATEFEGDIPQDILKNSCKTRFKYLIGLVDHFGNVEDDLITFDLPISNDLAYFGRSLGFAVTPHKQQTIFYKYNESDLTVTPLEIDDYYGFTVDQNNRFLLGDFTVTHNTCTAINIAEQYYDTFDRKVLVILSGNIEENFRKQIYDIQKVNQCTGTKYPDMVLNKHLLSKDLIEKNINTIIKQRYEFMGYKELAFYMKRKKDEIAQLIKDPKDPKKLREIELKREAAFMEQIRNRFSNRLMIIDEAHNLRLPSESGEKQISVAFLELLKIVENVKLVLMTATPMYNTADEIVWLMNLLLTNDRADTIKRSQLFTEDSTLTPEGKHILNAISRGRVSFMRGENPYSFPFRLFPSINNPKDPRILSKYPKKDIYGVDIPSDQTIKYLEILTSKMSDFQYKIYASYKKNIKPEDETDLPDEAPDENNDVQNTMQISNIVYPINDLKKKPYGSQGFEECFYQGKDNKYIYKDNQQGQFLTFDKLNKFAPKIKTIIEYIKKSKGIVFIYSRYYDSGIKPLACALEHAGMTRYSMDGKQRNIMDPSKLEVNDQFGGKKPRYIILSRKQELSPNNDFEIEKAKSKENADGSIIKVIIVSKIGTEGIDFKRIREVHIMEPWYNLNRAEQIIGRAVRTCSHVDLPKSQRNVTIYFHANTCGDEEESIDLRTYRISENKQKRIIQVENVLKEASIDCNLNKDTLVFPPSKLNVSFDIETSQGNIIKNYKVGDKDFSFICGFQPCEFKCNPEYASAPKIDHSTFDIEFITDDIQLNKKYVASLFIENPSEKTFKDIKKQLEAKYRNIQEDILSYALEEMIDKKYIITLPKGRGRLIYRSNKYIFQFENLQDTRMALDDRKQLLEVAHGKRLHLDLTKIKPAKPIVPEKPKPAAAVEKPSIVADSNFEDLYKTLCGKFVAFLCDSFISAPTSFNPNPKIVHEQILSEYLKKKYPKASDESAQVKQVVDLLNKYKEQFDDAVFDKLTIDMIIAIRSSTSTIGKSLQQAIDRANIVLKSFVIDPNTKTLYKDKDGKPLECAPGEKLIVKNDYDMFTAKVQEKPKEQIRYYTKWQNQKLVFKIRDTSSTLGAVCDTSPTLQQLIEKVQYYLKTSLPSGVKYQKSLLCLVLEIVSRNSPEFERALYVASK